MAIRTFLRFHRETIRKIPSPVLCLAPREAAPKKLECLSTLNGSNLKWLQFKWLQSRTQAAELVQEQNLKNAYNSGFREGSLQSGSARTPYPTPSILHPTPYTLNPKP